MVSKLAKSTICAASVALVGLACLPAQAAISLYTDRTTFTVDTGAGTVEDFTPGSHFPITSGVLNSSTTEAGLSPGDIEAGVTYSVPLPGSGFFFNIDAGGGFAGGFLDGLVIGGDRKTLTVDFDSAQGAFGFDTNTLMGTAFSIRIFGTSGLLYDETLAVSGPAFFGFASSEMNILSAEIAGNAASFSFALDNFTFNGGPVSGAIPEPSTWAMMILGFGTAGSLMRRRRTGRLTA
jgi:hypothetical protein